MELTTTIQNQQHRQAMLAEIERTVKNKLRSCGIYICDDDRITLDRHHRIILVDGMGNEAPLPETQHDHELSGYITEMMKLERTDGAA